MTKVQLNEAPDFHDPFSELSLFLARQVRQKLELEKSGRSWSQQLQEDLLRNIIPEFSQRFPRYFLNVSALKRVWEKGSFYLEQLQMQEAAFRPDGSVNVEVMIRENFRNYEALCNPYARQPYYHAQHLAVKISECIASLDGIRPDVDHLSKTIWNIQKNLSTNPMVAQAQPHMGEMDAVDRRLLQIQLAYTAENPLPPLSALRSAVRTAAEQQNLAQRLSLAHLEKKIELWAVQGDMVCRWVKVDNHTPGLAAARQVLEEAVRSPHWQWKEHSSLTTGMAKVLWYREWFGPTTPTIERWIFWQALFSRHRGDDLPSWTARCRAALPLVPIDRERILRWLFPQKEDQSGEEERKGEVLRHIQERWEQCVASSE